MRQVKVVGRAAVQEFQRGLGMGAAFFPHYVVQQKIGDRALILRGDYNVWIGVGLYGDAFLFLGAAPDSIPIVAAREFFSQIIELEDGKEDVLWPESPEKKLRVHLRDYQFFCEGCDHTFLPDLAKDEPGHRIRMEEQTFFPPKGKVGREWQPVQSSSQVFAECPLCGKETRTLKSG